jgi:hypothetical protein
MKKSLILSLLICLASLSFAQNSAMKKAPLQFGIAVNSCLSGVIGEVSIAPTGLMYINNHQLEIGLCLYPYNFRYPRMLGASLDYKYFPNGIDNRFNLYFVTHLNFTNEYIDHNYIINNYQTTYNYLALTVGYGFQVKLFDKAYIGTSLSFGVNTNSNINTDPQSQYERPMFESFEMDGTVQLNIGYRF